MEKITELESKVVALQKELDETKVKKFLKDGVDGLVSKKERNWRQVQWSCC